METARVDTNQWLMVGAGWQGHLKTMYVPIWEWVMIMDASTF